MAEDSNATLSKMAATKKGIAKYNKIPTDNDSRFIRQLNYSVVQKRKTNANHFESLLLNKKINTNTIRFSGRPCKRIKFGDNDNDSFICGANLCHQTRLPSS